RHRLDRTSLRPRREFYRHHRRCLSRAAPGVGGRGLVSAIIPVMGNGRKKYLVTGGAGFIGSNLVKKLVSLGSEVNVLDDMSRGQAGRLKGVPVTIFQGDVRDEKNVRAAMHGCDSVVHLAYLQGTQTFYAEPRQVLDVAMRGMLNVLAACEATGCAELLLVSSSEAYQVAPQVPTPE